MRSWPASPVHLPVPWARYPELNHLLPPAAVRALLKVMGFEEVAWIDETATALRWHQERLAATPGRPPPPGLNLVFGDDFGQMFRNQVLNLSEKPDRRDPSRSRPAAIDLLVENDSQ
jgi:sarcosine/dimethylglycine N-methyltransferase